MANLVNVNLTVVIAEADKNKAGVVNLYTGDFISGGQSGIVKFDNAQLTLLVDIVASLNYTVSQWELVGPTFSVVGDTEPIRAPTTLSNGDTLTLKLTVSSASPPAAGTPAPITDYGKAVMSNYRKVPTFTSTKSDGTHAISYSVVKDVVSSKGTFAVTYSVSIPFIAANLIRFHNVKSGEEVWQLVTAVVRNPHFEEGRLRYFLAQGGYLWFLLVSNPEIGAQDCRVKLVRYDYVNDIWEVRGSVSFGTLPDTPPAGANPPKYPSFGSVAVGHNGIVYANPVGAVYFPFDDNLEPVFFPLYSSAFIAGKTSWSHIAVLTVPEGFLFLPHGILWDLDTFYDTPVDITLSEDDRLVPVYLEDAPGVVVRTKEYPYSPGSTIKAYYVWGGLDVGLVKGKVGVAPSLAGEQAYPIYLGGSKVGQKWYAFNAYPHWDEATILEYSITKNASNPENRKDWQWTLTYKQFVLPLPFSAPLRNLPSPPPGWGEIWYFSTGSNNHYLYFGRLYERIYRLRVADKRVSIAFAIPYLDFAGNLIPRFLGVEPAQLLFSLNLSDGRVYACHVRSGGRVQIWRQSSPVTPPGAPNIVFPPADVPAPRKFHLVFQPAIDDRPQEFSVEIVVETAWGKQYYTYYSFIHRSLFAVSTDGGNTYSPMTQPIVVSNTNTYVKFSLPQTLPAGSQLTAIVTAYAIE